MYYFIVNPNSCRGLGKKIWKKLERQLNHSGVEYEVKITRESGDARRMAAEIMAEGEEPKVLVAVGGDGTVNEVLNGVSFEEPVTLGYIPAGTANDLARSLKISRNPARALKKILNPKHCKCLDYGILSYEKESPVHRRFAVSCGIGLDASVCHNLIDVRSRKKRCLAQAGKCGYVLLGLRQLLRFRPVKGYVLLDETKKVEFNHIYFVSSHIHGSEGGGFRMVPEADCCDGMLDVCVAHSSSKWQLFLMLLDALLGRKKHHRGIRFYRCREVAIHMETPVPVHVDGESCFCQKDVHLRCVERKVRMIV